MSIQFFKNSGTVRNILSFQTTVTTQIEPRKDFDRNTHVAEREFLKKLLKIFVNK